MKPILFSTPMVQAILDGRKTMTRRVIKDLPENTHYAERDEDGSFQFMYGVYGNNFIADGWKTINPKYQEGDILWVRETWCRYYYADEHGYTHYDQPTIYYAADGAPDLGDIVDADGFVLDDQKIKWRPSIFMPKEAARIFLRVTDVRVERVQDITETDAKAEGFDGVPCDHPIGRYACEDCMNTGWSELPTFGFMEIWQRLNDKRGYGWDVNPWVWVYRFERCGKPIDA